VYSARLAITRSLWDAAPTDRRAISDYGAAQVDLGLVIPLVSAAEKRAALERARDWLQLQIKRNTANPELREQLEKANAALEDLARGSVKP
jgi:hypothetical protein